MTTLLRQCVALDKQINVKLAWLAALEDIATKTTAANSNEPSGNRTPSDVIGKTIPKIVDLRKEINADIDNLYENRIKIMGMINKIPNPVSRELLTYRYVSTMKWKDVAEKMRYDYSYTVRELHRKALAEFRKYNSE